MPKRLRPLLRRPFAALEQLFNAAFTPAWNPFYHLGALSIFFFWVLLVTGIYVFIFFDTSVAGAWRSVEVITHEQWLIGGVMRSLHRYASDAAVITMALHLTKEFLLDRYRGPRWFSWFTGVPLIWLVFPLGITGYWLVWDRLAQYVAVASSEFLDVLPIFSEPMVRNFLTNESVSDRFFTFMAFLHLIGLPVFLLFAIWFHVLRISRPKVNPPLGLAVGSIAALTALSLAWPALSQPPADFGTVPAGIGFDWFYLFAYPLLDRVSPAALWIVLVGSSLALCFLPWLPAWRKTPPARVSLPDCNGCGRCVADCPYNAVSLNPRSDGLAYDSEAVVDADLCTRCGICAGACPTSTPLRRLAEITPGIDLPARPIRVLREETLAATARLTGEGRVLVYGCEHGPNLARLRKAGIEVVAVECIAQLPPSFLDFVITRRHAEGVMLFGCRENDCHYRLGVEWTQQRLRAERDPYLRARVPRERVASFWGSAGDTRRFLRELEKFRTRLRGYGPYRATTSASREESP